MMMVLDPVKELIDAAGISGTDAAPPVDHSPLDLQLLLQLSKDRSVLFKQVWLNPLDTDNLHIFSQKFELKYV